jgi:hypothetical protein
MPRWVEKSFKKKHLQRGMQVKVEHAWMAPHLATQTEGLPCLTIAMRIILINNHTNLAT